MSYWGSLIADQSSPFAILTTDGSSTQMTDSTQDWVDMDTRVVEGKGIVTGALLNSQTSVIALFSLSSADVGTTRDYYGVSWGFGSRARCFSDDSTIGYGASVEWAYRPTSLGSITTLDINRTRFTVIRTEAP
jgi:hypothetical protein